MLVEQVLKLRIIGVILSRMLGGTRSEATKSFKFFNPA